jgi:hypothetical protein
MNKVSEFQQQIIDHLKTCPNQMDSTWSIAQKAFPEKWKRRSGRGALIGHIVRAASKLDSVVILPPKGEYGDYTICLVRAQ